MSDPIDIKLLDKDTFVNQTTEIAKQLKNIAAATSKVDAGYTITLLDAEEKPMYVFSCIKGGKLFDVSPYPTKADTYHEASEYESNKTYYYEDDGEYVEDEDVVDSASFATEKAAHTKLYTRKKYSFKGWATDPTDEDTRISMPMYQPDEDNLQLYPIFTTGESGYVGNLGVSNPANVTFSKSAGFTADNLYEEVVVDGNTFAKFRPFYKKTILDNGKIVGYEISDTKESDNFVPYEAFLDENGNLCDYILLGTYPCSSTETAKSTNETRATMTISAGRALCAAKGDGYQQMDAAMFCFWRDLALAVKQQMNFNNGSGVDSYLGLKNMTAGGWWIDGLAHNGSTYLYCNDASKFADQPTTSTTGYSALSYSMPTDSGYCVKDIGYDSNHPTINFPSEGVSNSSYNTYYCDGVYYSSGNHPCNVYVGDAVASVGLFYLIGHYDWAYAYGVRLCYKKKPIQ